jgi:predicted naringenin-chalcone synthase
MSHTIEGIGTAVPLFEIEQHDCARQAAQICGATTVQERLLSKLYLRAGVKKRHSVVLDASTNGHPARQSFYTQGTQASGGPSTGERMQAYERYAAPLVQEAAQQALDEAGIAPGEITHLVTVSCSGFSAPGIDVQLICNLRLPLETSRTHIGFMGCHGALNGLRVARAFADTSSAVTVLVCALELCTLHHQFGWQSDQLVANSLFADGAAAVVVRQAGGPQHDWRIVDQLSALIPDSSDLMSWQIRDHGFQMSLSPLLPQLLVRELRSCLAPWLAHHALTVDQIRSWAIHPGGPRILDACAESLNLDEGIMYDSQQVLADFGNMSSPTLLFILKRLKARQAPRPCVALALGPGIAVEAALIC